MPLWIGWIEEHKHSIPDIQPIHVLPFMHSSGDIVLSMAATAIDVICVNALFDSA